MLDYVMDHNWFISLSFLLRITESLGSTGALVAAFSITAAAFPKAIGTTFVSGGNVKFVIEYCEFRFT